MKITKKSVMELTKLYLDNLGGGSIKLTYNQKFLYPLADAIKLLFESCGGCERSGVGEWCVNCKRKKLDFYKKK
jgi:hypothetical protein